MYPVFADVHIDKKEANEVSLQLYVEAIPGPQFEETTSCGTQ